MKQKRVWLQMCVQLDDPHETAGHSHAADVGTVAAAKVSAKMRTAVRAAPGVRPSTVLATELLQTTTPVRAAIGKKETIRRRLRRQKRGIQPPEPASLQEIDLPEEFTETGGANPEVFMIHDSGSTAQKRMLVFASEKQLQHLAASERYVSLSSCIVKTYRLHNCDHVPQFSVFKKTRTCNFFLISMNDG